MPTPSDATALEFVAAAASGFARQIREWFPIAGTPWMSDIHEPHIANNVVNAAVSLERALRAVPQRPWGLWQCLHDALAAVEKCHDRVLAHYQWTDRVKGEATTWPWEWPNVPPIPPVLLDALERSASRLAGFARDYAARRAALAAIASPPIGQASPPARLNAADTPALPATDSDHPPNRGAGPREAGRVPSVLARNPRRRGAEEH